MGAEFTSKLNAVIGLDSSGFDSGMRSVLGSVAQYATAAYAAQKITVISAHAIQDFATYEKGIRNITTLLKGPASASFGAIDSQIQSLNKQFGTGPQQQISAYYKAISAGFTQSNVGDFLETANKAAQAGMSDVGSTVEVLSRVMESYGLAADQAMDVSDTLFQTVKLGQVTFADLAAGVTNVTSFAPALGVSFQEVSAGIAQLSPDGGTASQAMTAMAGVMRALVKPTEDAKKEAARLGIGFGQAAVQSQGFTETLKLIAKATEGNSDSLGKLFNDQEGFRAVLKLTTTAAEGYNEKLLQMEDRTGAVDEAQKKLAESWSVKWGRVSAALDSVSLSLGHGLLESFAAATGAGNDFERSLVNIESVARATATSLLYVADSVGIVVSGYKSLLSMGNAFDIMTKERLLNTLTKQYIEEGVQLRNLRVLYDALPLDDISDGTRALFV